MKQSSLRFIFFALLAAAALCTATVQSVTLLRPAHDKTLVPSTAASFVQFDDPYSDFRNARYSNAGLLSEGDELKLGMQLHREVTKKLNLTNLGLDRVERIGQRCAKASLRPNMLYKFHVVQSREINGFSLPGGHVYITTALLRLANDTELASVLAHEVGHIVARHSLKTLKETQDYDDIAKSLGQLTGVAGNLSRGLAVALGRVVG